MEALDVSSNNHDGTVFNWQEAYEAGYRAVYIKATQNNNYLNPYLIGDCRDAKNAGFEVGIYHFYGTSTGTVATPEQQAAWFKTNGLDLVKEYATLVPVVDVETGNAGTVLQQEVETFIGALGTECGAYMNRSFQELMPTVGKFLWLAWPGWANEELPANCAIVQFKQEAVPGLGTKVIDIDNVLNSEVIGMAENKVLAAPIVGGAACMKGGYWLVGADGGVFAFGAAQEYGNMAGKVLARPIVGISGTFTGEGYWLWGADGGVFAFGDAVEEGSLPGLGFEPAS